MRALVVALPFFLFASGCPAPCDLKVVDADGDGFAADDDGDGVADQREICSDRADAFPPGNELGPDCDDDDAAINPRASELCDTVDNDCDGEVDEDGAIDAPPRYVDGDGDGHGDPDQEVLACSLHEGLSQDSRDCDDENAEIGPDIAELCDGIDNNCDGRIDEGTAEDARLWYQDADEDGHGNPGSTRRACEAPEGFVDPGDDCDDANAAVHPGADEVQCDGTDNDCDPETWPTAWAKLDSGEEFSTLDDALFRARPGAEITLCEGHYEGSFVVRGANKIASLGGAAVTILDGKGEGPVLVFQGDGGSAFDVTLRNGVGNDAGDGVLRGGAVWIEAGVTAQIRIQGAIVESNSADEGGAFWVPDDGDLVVRSSQVLDNHATATGGAIASGARAIVRVVDTLFTGNDAATCGAIALGEGTQGIFNRDTRVLGNSATSYGGGVCAAFGASIDDGVISENDAVQGGGVYLLDTASMKDVRVLMNHATSDGGGIYVNVGLTATGLEVDGNTALKGAGMHLRGQFDGAVSLATSAITTNVASGVSGGGIFHGGGTLDAVDCDLGVGATDNEPVDVSSRGTSATTDYEYGSGATFHCEAGVCE